MDNFLDRVLWMVRKVPPTVETPMVRDQIDFGRLLACKVIDATRDPSTHPDLLLRAVGVAGGGEAGDMVLLGFMREIQDALRERAP